MNLLPGIMCKYVFIAVAFSIIFTKEYMQEMICFMDHLKLDFHFLLLLSQTVGDFM